MRPAPRASTPACTAWRIACAIATGSSGARDRARAQHGVAPELHRQRRVGGRPDARVEDHRHAGRLDDQREVGGVGDAHAAADRRAERHHRGAAGVLQAAREHGVVVGVGQDDEAVVDELLGGGEQLRRVGQQRALVADHLELDPVGLQRLARELRGQHGVARGEAAGGVGQHVDALGLDDLQQRALRGRVDAAHRDGHELALAGVDGVAERLQAREAAGAEQQARAQLAAGDDERG